MYTTAAFSYSVRNDVETKWTCSEQLSTSPGSDIQRAGCPKTGRPPEQVSLLIGLGACVLFPRPSLNLSHQFLHTRPVSARDAFLADPAGLEIRFFAVGAIA